MDVVTYFRVRPNDLPARRLVLEEQRLAVERWVAENGATSTSYFVEEERGIERPVLAAAIEECKRQGATLRIASVEPIGNEAPFEPRIRSVPVAIIKRPPEPFEQSIPTPEKRPNPLFLLFGHSVFEGKIPVYLVNNI